MDNTLFDIGNDYEKLCRARDYAAYRAVGAMDAAIRYCRDNDPKMALSILLNARADYEKHDRNLQNSKTHTTTSSPAAQEAA